MKNEHRSRHPSMWNLVGRGFLVVASLTGVVALAVVMTLVIARHPSAGAIESARLIDMEVYSERDPFIVLVDRNFPMSKRFALLATEHRVILQTDRNGAGVREVTLGFGPDVFISCNYYPSANGDLREITLSIRETAYNDLNADGAWDVKMIVQPEPSVHVWYQGQWHRVDADVGDKHHKTLLDGEEVVFDLVSGIWENNTGSGT